MTSLSSFNGNRKDKLLDDAQLASGYGKFCRSEGLESTDGVVAQTKAMIEAMSTVGCH